MTAMEGQHHESGIDRRRYPRIGSLVGGRAKKRAAKKLAADIDAAASDVIQQTKNDAQQALALARDDERRLKEATGYDLGKLRDDAIKAGFNPLTVLQATGAAGYDGRGAVVTSPFVAEAPAWEARMNAKLSAGGAVVDTSGYVGQAISAAGSGYFDQRNADAQLETEKLRTQLMQAEFQNIAGGSAGSGYTPFGAPVRGVTASPVTAFGGSGVTSDGLPAGEPPMQVQPASSEFMWKKVRTGIPGYDVWVYNDEASESEVASTLSLGTVPIQMFDSG